MKNSSVLILSLLCATFACAATAAEKGARIKKCQDEKGVWHYGDSADEACAKSKVTVIDDKGLTRKEIAAPLTEEELKERERTKAAREAERKAREEQAKRDQLLLATYGHEDDIDVARDRKLAMIDAQIKTIESTLTTLRATLTRMQAHAGQEKKSGGKDGAQTEKDIEKTEAQIREQEKSLAARRQEQETIRQRYAEELKHYREVKARAISAQSAAPKK